MSKIAVGMSGGVDSSVAAALLKEQGYDILGVTLSLCRENLDDVKDAKAVCDKLSIAHTVMNFQKEFRENVIGDFISQYQMGNTPNPCIVCNRTVKFGKMLEEAVNLGCDKIATGHYAKVVKSGDRYLLSKPKDIKKDQSYVLYCLSQQALSRTLLPLGDLKKEEVREIAQQYGFVNAHKKDSQDICFVPDGDYARFIEKETATPAIKGDFVDITGKKIGEHQGIINYTIGQRKGLGIAMGRPVFVLSKDAQTNKVVIGDEQELFYNKVLVENVNFIPFDSISGDIKVKCKLRYRHTEEAARLIPIDLKTVMVEFENPQRAASGGQAAVFYDGETVIGGGTIVKGVK